MFTLTGIVLCYTVLHVHVYNIHPVISNISFSW